MKVYALFGGMEHDRMLIGVFTEKADAERIVGTRNDDWLVEEHELDVMAGHEWMMVYRAWRRDADRTVRITEPEEEIFDPRRPWSVTRGSSVTVAESCLSAEHAASLLAGTQPGGDPE